jgi:hypothetical protein
VTGPAAVALGLGDGLSDRAGDSDGEGVRDGVREGERDLEGEGDPKGDPDARADADAVDVTLAETATPTGRGVDSRQAASASKPSNAGPATPSYRIPRPYLVAISPHAPAVQHAD